MSSAYWQEFHENLALSDQMIDLIERLFFSLGLVNAHIFPFFFSFACIVRQKKEN